MSNTNVRTAILAAFVALMVSAVFLILVSLPPEATCEEYGRVPIVLEEGGGIVCIPWENVVLDD